MKCAIAERYLSAYIDRELAEDVLVEVEKHLHGCNACRIKHEMFNSIWQDLENLQSEPVPAYFYTRLQAKLQSLNPFTRFRDRVLIPLSFGLVMFLGAITGSMVMSDKIQLSETAFAETSETITYIEDHLQDFPESSFSQAYMDIIEMPGNDQGE